MVAALKHMGPEKETLKWHRRYEEVEFLKTRMSYEKVREAYYRMLISEEKRIVELQTFPQKD